MPEEKCTACGEKATKYMTLMLGIEPDEPEGYMSYKKIPGVKSSYFCDKHCFELESVIIDKELIRKKTKIAMDHLNKGA